MSQVCFAYKCVCIYAVNKQESHIKALCPPMISGTKAVCINICFAAAVYRFQQVSDILYRRNNQQQQQGGEDHEEDEAQSLDMWLLTDSTLAQLMDPQLAAPAVQFLVLEVGLVVWTRMSICHASLHKTLSMQHNAAFGQKYGECESAVPLCLHTVAPAAAAAFVPCSAEVFSGHQHALKDTACPYFHNAYPSLSPTLAQPIP